MQEINERSIAHKGKQFALKLFETKSGFTVAAYLDGQQVGPSYSVDILTHTDYFMQHRQSLTENLFSIARSDIEQELYIHL